jgi:hypothetical protein
MDPMHGVDEVALTPHQRDILKSLASRQRQDIPPRDFSIAGGSAFNDLIGGT